MEGKGEAGSLGIPGPGGSPSLATARSALLPRASACSVLVAEGGSQASNVWGGLWPETQPTEPRKQAGERNLPNQGPSQAGVGCAN